MNSAGVSYPDGDGDGEEAGTIGVVEVCKALRSSCRHRRSAKSHGERGPPLRHRPENEGRSAVCRSATMSHPNRLYLMKTLHRRPRLHRVSSPDNMASF